MKTISGRTVFGKAAVRRQEGQGSLGLRRQSPEGEFRSAVLASRTHTDAGVIPQHPGQSGNSVRRGCDAAP